MDNIDRRDEKSERLYAKFCKDMGLDTVRAEVLEAAIAWYDAFGTANPRIHAQAELRLCEAIEKAKSIIRQARLTANIWADTDQEPA